MKTKRISTGLKDQFGTLIHTGDIIEFYFNCDLNPNAPKWKKGGWKDYTRMRDLVKKIDGEFYAVCEWGCAFLWRYNKTCKVIGTNKKLIDT